jgi:hypothetical protein
MYAAEFPRIEFAGNSSHCIKLEVKKEQDYYFSLPVPIFRNVLPFQIRRLALPSLTLAVTCNAGRILMQLAA